MANNWYRHEGDTLVITVRAQPKSSADKIVGIENNCLKLKITSPPVDGKANKHLQHMLAKLFGVAKSKVSLVRGEKSRDKAFAIIDGDLERLIAQIPK